MSADFKIILLQVVFPPGLAGKLRRIVGALSLLSLARSGCGYVFGPALQSLLEGYGRLLGLFFDRLEPLIIAAMPWIDALYPHTRHIFVLMALYCLRGPVADFKEGSFRTGAIRFFISFIIVALTSIFAGRLPLTNSAQTNFWLVTIPLFGTAINDLVIRGFRALTPFARQAEENRLGEPISSPWQYFNKALVHVALRTAFGLGIFALVLWSGVIASECPALLLLAVLVIGLGMYQLWLAAEETPKLLHRHGGTRLSAFLRSRGATIGLEISGVIAWAVIGYVANVALSLF